MSNNFTIFHFIKKMIRTFLPRLQVPFQVKRTLVSLASEQEKQCCDSEIRCVRKLVFEATESSTSNFHKVAALSQLGGSLVGFSFSILGHSGYLVPLLFTALGTSAISDLM